MNKKNKVVPAKYIPMACSRYTRTINIADNTRSTVTVATVLPKLTARH